MSLRESADARVIAARKGLREQLVQLWIYRGLLRRMVAKELQVKYKNSVLGFLWSLLNPALYLVIFTVVFQFILGSGIPRYAIFLLSGLLVWNFFSMAVGSATTSISHNGPLVGKVYFPREVLPLASVGAALVHFFLQTSVLVIALIGLQHDVAFRHIALVPAALAILVVLAAGFALFLAAANVYLRDVEHFVELALLAWFWMTPIVYPQQLVAEQLAGKSWSWVQWLNPLTSIVLVFQRGFYNVLSDVTEGSGGARPIDQATGDALNILPTNMDLGWYVGHLGVIGAVATVVLIGGFWVFGRVEGNFAEEL